MQPVRNREKSAGFTLLEVMVAVAVLAVGVVPLLVTHAATVANIRRSRELTVASLLARDRLAGLEVYGFLALSGETDLFPPVAGPESGAAPPAFLEIEQEVEEIEKLALLEARVAVNRLPRPAGKDKDRPELDFATYIVNLYFEPEKELVVEE